MQPAKPEMKTSKKLQEVIQSGRRLIIFLHDHPDPDAIASGWILSRIAEHLGVRPQIVYGGRLGRAENRTMVKLLRIPLRSLEERPIRPLHSDRYALVDTQPGTGNNSFPHQSTPCHIVIDHHPRLDNLKAEFIDIESGQGSCTTRLAEYHQIFGLNMDSMLATATVYAILSETQDLGREANHVDLKLLERLMPLAKLRLLGQIRHPVRSRNYYRTVARAMREVVIARNTCVCHIGSVDEPEMVAEMADFLVSMERITWCLTTGYVDGNMALSLRTTQTHAEAQKVMKKILNGLGKGGGHGMLAGGLMTCANLEGYQNRLTLITRRFLSQLHRKQTENLKPLVEIRGEHLLAKKD